MVEFILRDLCGGDASRAAEWATDPSKGGLARAAELLAGSEARAAKRAELAAAEAQRDKESARRSVMTRYDETPESFALSLEDFVAAYPAVSKRNKFGEWTDLLCARLDLVRRARRR